eukprot:7748515-Pyramimonas_sp.AAC.1
MHMAKQMIDAYHNRELKKKRAQFLAHTFPLQGHQTRTIVLMAANLRGMHLVLNWACGCNALGIEDVRRDVLLITTDINAFHFASKAGFHALHPDLMGHAATNVPPAYEHEKMSGFNGAMASLWVVLAEMLKAGYTAMPMDADIVWLRDPRPWLHFHNSIVDAVSYTHLTLPTILLV